MSNQKTDLVPVERPRPVSIEALRNPVTVVSTGVGLGALALIAVVGAGHLLTLVMGIGLGLGLASWIFNLSFRRERIGMKAAKRNFEKFQENENKRVDAVKQSLVRLKYEPSTEKLAEQGLEQLKSFNGCMQVYERLVTEKFSPTEIAFSRYSSAGQTTKDTILKSLEHVVLSLSLKKETEAAELLVQNQGAIEGFMKVSRALNDISNDSNHFQDLIEELENLAARAKKFQ